MRLSHALHHAPPEALFVVSAAAQYTGAVVAIGLFDDIGPATVAWIRVLSAALILIAISGRSRHAAWTRRDMAWAAVFGSFTALMNLTFYLAVDRLPLGKGVTIEFVGPVAVAAFTTRTRRNTVALLAASVGVVVLGGVEIGREPLGLVFIAIASAMWAGHIVAGSRVALADRGVAGLGWGLLAGALLVTPFGMGGAPDAFASPRILGLCVLVGLLSNAIGYGVDQTTLRRIPVRRFSVLLALLPVTASAFGAVFLRQTPSGADLAGILLVLTGVMIQEREERERPRPASPTT